MKKITVQIVTAILLWSNISCSNEKELVIDEQSQNIVLELPENAISLNEIINNLKEELGETSTSERLINSNLGGADKLGDDPIFYEKFFVVYPRDWTTADKFGFYQRERMKHVEIFIVTNSCEYIDTWYIPSKNVDDSFRDRAKNLIVASNSGLNGSGSSSELEGDGPQLPPNMAEVYYKSCKEIPVSLIHNN
ncbi:hypothetical protein [uncultured Tenacibaculum sp.]|uniref:hypothetical protein n=1 Tax=uncultured Tenacibaculum sp. TaxID=174713 RepID=UPI002608309E|nr:hypothetical protein [uncultured Tenacibaculum sp.]